MKKPHRSRIIVLTAALSVALTACTGSRPEPPKPDSTTPSAVKSPEKTEPDPPRIVRGPHDIEIFESSEMVLAYLEIEGIPYAEMGDEIARVARLLEKQDIRPQGFSRTLYLDDPRDVDTSRYHYRVGFPVAGTDLPRKPLRCMTLPARLVARAQHRGDYDEAYQVRFYEEIPAILEGMGYVLSGSICEIYRYPVVEKDPKAWLTELWYPVKKKTQKKQQQQQKKKSQPPSGRKP